ncbi:MAG: DDE-type integrase/transposase/recombinase [Longimicrobiales bacterium]
MGEANEAAHERWARLRFSVVGPLLAAPPAGGELGAELARLAAKVWRHPITGEPVRFARSTIERWYYAARGEARDPVGVLRRRVRKDAGTSRGVSLELAQAIRAQYREHPAWSYRLHVDNLRVVVRQHPALGPLPSYATIRRWMKAHGLLKKRRRARPPTAGEARAEVRLAERETRSFEAEYVNALWHLDFHVGSRKVPVRSGRWLTPHLLGVVDDRSRLACHLQWYLAESTETLVHGLSQAIMKRGRPRALLTDNGSAMLAAETTEGLLELSIHHETTLPHSPHQNGKQEVLWAQVEGRLLSMLEGVTEITLDLLNEATQAWIELEYNRALHAELGCAPLERFLADRSVGLESPSAEALRQAFRMSVWRTQRRSDGTISLFGRRFEVPSHFRHLERLCLRCARWDLSSVELVDARTRSTLARLWPLDKTRNADGRRRTIAIDAAEPTEPPPATGMAPLLKELLARYAATGLPPAYLPHAERTHEENR